MKKFFLLALSIIIAACSITPAPPIKATPITTAAPTSAASPNVAPSPTSSRPFLITPTSNGLFPFVLPWDDASAGVTNVSAWIEKPAGKNGFVIAKDGHLYSGEKRLRLFGVNIVFDAAMPSQEEAEKIAARLAKFGVNAVRFHHLDSLPAPRGLLQKDKRTLDPEMMDRLDYFIAQLKKNGIYSDLNLHVGRLYPDLPIWDEMPQYFKGVDNFYPRMIEFQHEYARDLLTHLNPYTNTRYVDEPAIVFVEINNEDGLMREWWGSSLDNMPKEYTDELSKQWRAWLKEKYKTNDALKQAWNTDEQPLGSEMLLNGNFAQNINNWSLQTLEGAKATTQIVNDASDKKTALQIQVQQIGKAEWHVQLFQQKLRVQQDKAYTLTFWAKADKPRAITVNGMQAHAPWKSYSQATIALTKDWQPFTFTFTPDESDDNARVTFSNMGRSTGTYWLANVSLKPGGVYGVRQNESLDTMIMFRRAEFANRAPEAQRDWLKFLWRTEELYWNGIYQYLKNDLKARSLIIGSQTQFSPAPIQAQMDVVDQHAYWHHPRFPLKPWDPVNWSVDNSPMAGASDGGTLPNLALRRIADKPYVITEYNHPAPSTYSSEAFLLLSAFAALQDWDGIFVYNYDKAMIGYNAQYITSYFEISQHPTKMVTLPASAALFLRGDTVSPPTQVVAAFNPDTVFDHIRKTNPIFGAEAFGVNRLDALRYPVALSLNGKTNPAPTPLTDAKVIVSENKQLTWNTGDGKGFVTVNTPHSKAMIGYGNKRVFELGDVRLTLGKTIQDWAAITLTAMEGNDFKSPARILITATGYAENTNMGWKDAEKTTVGKDWGKAPSLVEGIQATITLPVEAKRVRLWSLDERGQRIGEITVRETNGNAVLELSEKYGTLWYEVEIK